MKKILTVLFSVLLCLSVCGCHVERVMLGLEKVYEKFDGELERGVKLKILENDTAKEAGYFDELITAFNEAYSEYGIVAEDAKMSGYTDLAQLGPLGKGPDVIYQANDQIMKYADDRHVQPLPVFEYEDYDLYPTNAWKAYETTISKQTFTCGVPVNIQTPMIYYRQDMLPADWETNWDDDKNGIPDMLENWNEMYRYSKEILATNPAGTPSEFKKYGYMQSLSDQYFSCGYLFTYGAYIFGDGNNTKDIGFSNGEAEKGGNIVRQLAENMNSGTTDDSITVKGYEMLAKGNYFAVCSTPDTYSLFYERLVNHYQESEELSYRSAQRKATENLKRVPMPTYYPASGDLTDYDSGFIEGKTMGGINGYAVSSYCKAPKAAWEFVKFATQYDWVARRTELLSLAPARGDLAKDNEISKLISESLEANRIVLMPSTSSVSSIWPPLATFFKDVSGDPFRESGKHKYLSLTALKEALERVDSEIYQTLNLLS